MNFFYFYYDPSERDTSFAVVTISFDLALEPVHSTTFCVTSAAFS